MCFFYLFVQLVTQLLLLQHRRLIAVIIHRLLFFTVLSDHLHHKVWVGPRRKLLIAHVHIRVHLFKVFVLFTREEAVVFALMFNLVNGLSLEALLDH